MLRVHVMYIPVEGDVFASYSFLRCIVSTSLGVSMLVHYFVITWSKTTYNRMTWRLVLFELLIWLWRHSLSVVYDALSCYRYFLVELNQLLNVWSNGCSRASISSRENSLSSLHFFVIWLKFAVNTQTCPWMQKTNMVCDVVFFFMTNGTIVRRIIHGMLSVTSRSWQHLHCLLAL